MKHKKDWGPGIRFFKCDSCNTEWQDISRDCTSLSGEHCPNESCEDRYFGSISPYKYETRYDWPTDPWGNLIEGHKYE